ncbi:RMD1 family protein [Roseomonas elaeocarpi]|uniref:RMD1 family protein n=1 Tax=Roseomonas elaeocarpi TaxID=907779 RepID=A0ABV6JLT3_9PROT
MAEPKIVAGQVIVLRLFDLAYEIDLRKAEALWSERTREASARSRLMGTSPKAVSFGVPPLALTLGPVPLGIGGTTVTATAGVRLYDFGIAALALRLPAMDVSWKEFTELVNGVDRLVGPGGISAPWDALLGRLGELLAESLDRPSRVPLQEDYLIAMVERFDTPLTSASLQERLDLVPLLSGEARPLSEGAQRDLLRHRFSYHPDDLAVVTWDRAFLYEPQGETDVADVLEMANAQLLEMRTYDEMLDDELPRVRDLVEAARRQTSLLASRRYSRLAQRLHTTVAEVTELTERVDNALQVTEDVYLARVYAAAIELFRVPNVSAAVDRKLATIRETYTALHGEAASTRAEVLEVMILVLIALEILLSLVRP